MASGQIDSIVNSAATQKQIDDLVKGLDLVIAKLESVAVKAGQVGVDMKGVKSIKELTAATQQYTAAEQEAIKAGQQEEKLTAQITLLQSEQGKRLAELNAQKKIAAERTRLQAETNAQLVGAYKALLATQQQNKNELKNLAAEGKTTSDRYKELSKQVQEADAKIKHIDATVGEHQKNVGNYSSALDGLKAGWVAVTAALAAGGAAIATVGKFIGDVISSTEALNDSWVEMTTGLKYGWDMVLRSFAQGDFSNFVDRMNEAINVGREYARTLDDLEKRVRSVSIRESELNNAIDAERLALKNVNLTTEERQKHIDKLVALEKGLSGEKLSNAKILYDAELKNVQLETGLSRFVIENYVKQYQAFSPLIAQAESYNEAVKNRDYYTKRALETGDSFNSEQAKKYTEEVKNTSSSVVAFASVVAKMGKVGEGSLKKLEDSWVGVNNVTHEYNLSVEKSLTKSELLDKKADTAAKNANKERDAAKQLNDEYERQVALVDQLLNQMGVNGVDRMTPIKSKGVITGASDPKKRKIDKSPGDVKAPGSDFPSEIVTLTPDELLAKDQEEWTNRLEMTRQFVDQINTLINSIYENKIRLIDEDASRDEKSKEQELKAAGDNQKKKDEIEAKYRQKEAIREKERKKALHDQAVYNKAIAATQIVINTAVQAMSQKDLLSTIAVIALGAIQLAAVLAQNIPSYRTGRKGGKAEFAKVHTGELIRYPDGKLMPTPDGETTTFLPAGADVITANEAMNVAGNLATPRASTAVTVNVNDKYGKEMLAEMRKEKKQSRVIDAGLFVIYEQGNYRQVCRK